MRLIEVANVDFSLHHFLLPLMRAARARGHAVTGAAAEGPLLAQARAEGFEVAAIPLMRSADPRALVAGTRALKRLFDAERPDMVHAHMPLSGFAARVAARASGVSRVAYTGHGFLFRQPANAVRRGGSFAMEWVGGRMTDIYLTVSEEDARDARRLRIARRASFTRNGRDPARFRPNSVARAKIRGELGVPEARPVIAAVSRIVPHKGFRELAAAMRAIPDAELWVVGERLASDRGEDLTPLLRAGNVRRLGYRADVADILAAADVFTLPSHFEGLPMSVIEAMLCGLPVVASDIRGPREQVLDGVTGFLVPPMRVPPLAAALARLCADPALRETMGAAGRARACALYDEAVVLTRTLDLLGL